MSRRNALVTTAVVAVIALLLGIGLYVQSGRDRTGEQATDPTGVSSEYGVVVGEADAPTTIVVYEDFQCPVCGAFEAMTAEQVRAAVDACDVKVEYRIVSFLDRASLNDYSSGAANAALVVLDEAGPEAFREFHDLLFAQQPEEGTAGPDDDGLVDLAVEAGADRDAVADGIDADRFGQWVVNATDAMSVHGVTGTPTVFIDGELAGATPQEMVDAVLAAVT